MHRGGGPLEYARMTRPARPPLTAPLAVLAALLYAAGPAALAAACDCGPACHAAPATAAEPSACGCAADRCCDDPGDAPVPAENAPCDCGCEPGPIVPAAPTVESSPVPPAAPGPPAATTEPAAASATSTPKEAPDPAASPPVRVLLCVWRN